MSVGCHVSKGKHKLLTNAIEDSLEEARTNGLDMRCAQIFVMGPRKRAETLSDVDKVMLRKIGAEVKIVVHSAYVNHPWMGGPGLSSLVREIEISADIGAVGVVCHLSKHVRGENNDFADFKRNIANIGIMLSERAKKTQTLFLEINAAKRSTHTFETTQKLAELFNVVADAAAPFKIGLCIDTAHLCSCGNSLVTAEKAEEWLKRLPTGVPIMLHLNDSKIPEGGGRDEHEALLRGTIWGAYDMTNVGESGLGAIMEWVEDNNIITVLERRADDLPSDYAVIAGMGYFKYENEN